MAGAFGFEAGKYARWRTIAEHGLLPEIAEASAETVIIAMASAAASRSSS
jgi:hypothetical protein